MKPDIIWDSGETWTLSTATAVREHLLISISKMNAFIPTALAALLITAAAALSLEERSGTSFDDALDANEARACPPKPCFSSADPDDANEIGICLPKCGEQFEPFPVLSDDCAVPCVCCRPRPFNDVQGVLGMKERSSPTQD
ncbi:hypothetical protein FHG87_003807 [Trinorchestia longiramus]|nr:hypothetical protein FHG87_003807 [Trinorchestia longiramus]